MIEKIIKPFITPIKKKIIMPLKRLKNWPKLLAKWIKRKFKEILGQKEITKASYVRFGNVYVSKKLIIIVILVILILYFFIFIKPPKFINKLFNKKPAIAVTASGPASPYSGDAKLVDENGAVLFEGALVGGVYDGAGKLYWPDGTIKEEGTYTKGALVEGSRYDESGSLVYTGGFADDVYEGQGRLYFANGKVAYQGEYKAGAPNGMGRQYTEDGVLRYEGGFANGSYSGEGTTYGETGAMVYQGGFLNGMYNGTGKLLYENGFVRYEGSFSNGKASGAGNEFYESGNVKYEGGYLAGQYNGAGTLYADNGVTIYSGGFVAGQYQGEGKLYNALGLVEYEGLFVGGSLSGLGIWYKEDGTVLYRGHFTGGEPDVSGYLGLSAVRLEELLGKSTGVEILNAPTVELDAALLDELNTEAFVDGAAEIAEAVEPSLKMRFQELKLAFIVELDESGSGEVAVSEVQLSSGAVLDRLAAQLVRQAQPSGDTGAAAATVEVTGQQHVYTWNDRTYSIELNNQDKPINAVIR